MKLKTAAWMPAGLLLIAAQVHAGHGADAGTASAPEAARHESAAEEAAPPVRRGSRLKFRDGPVCMCGSGLKESDIRAARDRESRASSPEHQGR